MSISIKILPLDYSSIHTSAPALGAGALPGNSGNPHSNISQVQLLAPPEFPKTSISNPMLITQTASKALIPLSNVGSSSTTPNEITQTTTNKAKTVQIDPKDAIRPGLVLIFSNYLIAKDIAIASRTCREWRFCITKGLYWDMICKKSYPGRYFGHSLLKMHPNRSVEQMRTILSEINQIEVDTVQALGGQAEIDKLPLIAPSPIIKNILDCISKGLGKNTIVRFQQRNQIRLIILKINAADKYRLMAQGFSAEQLDKTIQVLLKLDDIWKKKQKLIEENPSTCTMQLIEGPNFHALTLSTPTPAVSDEKSKGKTLPE